MGNIDIHIELTKDKNIVEMIKMIIEEIEALKNELNNLIGRDADYTEIYELSLKLDSLILKFYQERVTVNS